MEQVLRDPIWQFVGAALSFIALIVAIAAIRFQQQRRSLGYYCSHDQPVFYLFNRALKNRLVVTLDGSPVQGLRTVDIAVFNDGNVPILPTDYVEPIQVQFPSAFKVLGAGIKESEPDNLGVTISETNRLYQFSPVLLNPGDEFLTQFLIEELSDESHGEPTVMGRIAGVKSFDRRSSRPAPRYRYRYYSFRAAMALPYFVLGALAASGASVLYGWFVGQ